MNFPAANAEGRQVGYRVVLPPGWVRLGLREDLADTVEQILDRSFAQLPRGSLRKPTVPDADLAKIVTVVSLDDEPDEEATAW